MQIRIAEELTKAMQKEGPGLKAIEGLVDQCFERDGGWKEYYKKRMAELETEISVKQQLEREVSEREAEILYRQGHYQQAADELEKLANTASDSADKGWYLQLMASYLYPLDSNRSMEIQLKAHTENYNVFLPETGVSYSKLQSVGLSQIRQIERWIKNHESYNSLILDLTRILDATTFSSPSDSFEEGIDGVGRILGLGSQRPEKVTGQGPDNLWQLGEKNYWVIECKNRVEGGRKEISKGEVGQLNNDVGWFVLNYEGCSANYLLVHPSPWLAKDAFPNTIAWILSEEGLNELKENVKKFYNSLKTEPIPSLTSDVIKQKLVENHLTSDNLSRYLKRAERQGKKR